MCQLSISIPWFDVLHDLRVTAIPFAEKEIALGKEIYELLMQVNGFPFGISTTETIVNIKRRVNSSCGFREIQSIICGIVLLPYWRQSRTLTRRKSRESYGSHEAVCLGDFATRSGVGLDQILLV